ncbi:YraN family protein [Leucobacter sp. gxy201]|uniref:YraN family protein n=1 Tax=Leucobacter sp. gxy201 TaxID=2957200 RepID=UPI003D9FDF6A
MNSTEPRAQPRSTGRNQQVGSLGETIAADFLEEQGYRVLARNWRNRTGELDLVVCTGSTFVAVEVKTRRGSGYGTPLEAITQRKVARLRRLLLDWARDHGHRGAELRVDAIGITLLAGAAPRIDHLRGVS